MSDTETRKLSVWNYFEKSSDEKQKAECLLCHKVLVCSTSHNLKNHLKCMHSDEVDVSTNLLTRTRKFYKKENDSCSTRELVQKAFTKVEGDKVAMCNLCHKILSFRSTIGNLKHHLRNVHHDQYPMLLQIKAKEEDDDDDDEEEYNGTYFQVVEDEEVSNLYSPETESRDIKKKKKKYEVKDGEVYTEVIYLEEEEAAQKPSINKYNSKNSSIKSRKLFPKRRMLSFNENQSLDENLRMEQTPVSNELDKFGQYIATLLASMPKYICTKLQMNIVNQIMEEKLKIEIENENISVADNNAAPNKGSSPNRKKYVIGETGAADNDNSDTEVSDMRESASKYHKYIITENADIAKNRTNINTDM